MKYLKLIGIFAVIVGALFFVLNWDSLFNSNQGDEPWGEENQIDISEKCEEISAAWSQRTGWDQALYQSQRDEIDQQRFMGMYTEEGYNAVDNRLRETAINKACEGYAKLLNSSEFSDSRLQTEFAGVRFLKEAEKVPNDPRIKHVEQLHQLYTNIKNFVNSPHTITAKFNTSRADWVSFTSAESSILNTARSYLNNPLFKEMQNVPGFQAGLNEANIKKVTSPQRRKFYESLSAQIIRYFKNEEPTEDKINLLNQIYKNFTYQESKYGVDDLAMLKVTYGQ